MVFLKHHTNYCIQLYRVHLTTARIALTNVCGDCMSFFQLSSDRGHGIPFKSRQYKVMQYAPTININGQLLTPCGVALTLSIIYLTLWPLLECLNYSSFQKNHK